MYIRLLDHEDMGTEIRRNAGRYLPRVEKKNQIDATEWFIALIIGSTCFGHLYTHHQELETICVLFPPMMCTAWIAACWRSGSGQQAMRSG